MHGRIADMRVLGAAGQPGLGVRLRVPVPGAADSPPGRPHRPQLADRAARARQPTCAENDERTDYLRATLRSATACTVATPFPVQDSLHAGASREGRLPASSRALRPGGAGREPVRHH